MSRTPADIENLNAQLDRRGFRRDPRPVQCTGCGERAVFLYALKQTNLGGRQIEWCHACHIERSWTRRGVGNERELDESFSLESFLG